MKRTLVILAVLFPILTVTAQDPAPIHREYAETFDDKSLSATRLLPLPSTGSLRLTPSANGHRLQMIGDIGFALPIDTSGRVELTFDFEYAGGQFLLGDDRDPQHGFSKILHVDTHGKLRLTGNTSTITLARKKVYRIKLAWKRVTSTQIVIERLTVSDGTTSRTLKATAPVRALKGLPVPILHRGAGSVYLDNLHVSLRR